MNDEGKREMAILSHKQLEIQDHGLLVMSGRISPLSPPPSLLPRARSSCVLAGTESHVRNSHLRGDKQLNVRPVPGSQPIKHLTLLCLWLLPLCVQALVQNLSQVIPSASACQQASVLFVCFVF